MAKILKVLLVLLVLAIVLPKFFEKPSQNIKFGITFSPRYASYLNLDWKNIYLDMLTNLKIKNLRLVSYWDSLQKEKGNLDSSETDYLINEAGKHGARVILVLGERQPRWPECYVPVWARSLSMADRHARLLQFIEQVVTRYKNNPAIWAWQVENEPFVSWFGQNCDSPDEKFLQEEINLVKKMDTKRPVIVTDSGEWSNWIVPMTFSDILGISLYKKAYNQTLNQYITYPFSPWMYSLKSSLVRKLFARENKETIISELQTEPWFQKSVLDTPLDKQLKLFSVDDFKGNIKFAKKTGFGENYLWGVEWWYFMKAHGHPEYLDYARTLFRD